MTALSQTILQRLGHAEVQPFVPLLNEWLLPGAYYGVHHTWPQLYRRDGDGHFYGLFAGNELLSHCAWRQVRVRSAHGPLDIALLGSVATAPIERGCGHATRLLLAAVDDCRARGLAAIALWAEHASLYARAGFVAGPPESTFALRAANQEATCGVRLATVADHAALAALHAKKPLAVARTASVMSGLLTTPGMWTCVLEQAGAIRAYACTGKGADLQGWWHELGGDDDDVAALLPAAMRLVQQRHAMVLLPPYRHGLVARLAASVCDQATVAGPMLCNLTGRELPPLWFDGLDSV